MLKERILHFFDSAKKRICAFCKAFATSAKEKSSAFRILLLDYLGSLFFLSALVIALKPELLSPFINKNMADIAWVSQTVNKAGRHFLQITITETLADTRILFLRNAFVLLLLAFYLLAKCTVVLHSKKTLHKVVSLLLLAMSIVSCALIADKFIFFLVFATLLFVCFQYSIALETKQIVLKLIRILFIELLLYITVLLLETPDFILGCTLMGKGIVQAFSKFGFHIHSAL